MKKTILLIDGENFRYKVEEILREEKVLRKRFSNLNIDKLVRSIFLEQKYKITEKRYYCAKIHAYKETEKQSKKLIAEQRTLKNKLEKQNLKVVIVGNVRLKKDSNNKITFKEKGVDVKIAIDLVSIAYNKQAKSVVLCSSDSDLQPAVKEARIKALEVIYLGFELNPNKGLTFTTNKTILIKNIDILNCLE